MKHARQLMALLIALTLLLSLSATAFAAEDIDKDSDKYTIKITDGVPGQSYTAYKVFDVTLATADGNSTTDSGFAYTISSNSEWWDTLTSDIVEDATSGVYNISKYGLTFTPSATTGDTIYVVTSTMNAEQAATLAADLANDSTKPATAGSIDSYDKTNKNTIVVSELGYYFVDTSMGALCSLDTTNQDVTIYEKNSAPTLELKVEEDADTPVYGVTASADIGQTVNFKLTVNVGNNTHGSGTGVDENYVITVELPAGMTYTTDSFIITDTVDATDWTTDTDVTATYAGNKLTITLKQSELALLPKNSDVVITYSATLDEDCVLAGAGNVTTAQLTYGTFVTPETSATVYTYAMALKKYNSNGADLANATFSFPFNATVVSAGSATEPAVYKRSDVKPGTTPITTPASGVIIVVGLDADTYTLTETAAPAGYNLLTETVSVTVKETHQALAENVPLYDHPTENDKDVIFEKGSDDTADDTTYMVAVESIKGVLNQTGAELPSTGGMGTTLFYVIGGLLAVGALVLLITNKRMKPEF